MAVAAEHARRPAPSSARAEAPARGRSGPRHVLIQGTRWPAPRGEPKTRAVPDAGVNRVLLSGRLRGGISVRASPGGALELRFWLDPGDAREPTGDGLPQLVLVRDPAVTEALRDQLRRGSYLYVEGSLRTLRTLGRDGRDRWYTVICARRLELLCSQAAPASNRRAPWAREPLPAAVPP